MGASVLLAFSCAEKNVLTKKTSVSIICQNEKQIQKQIVNTGPEQLLYLLKKIQAVNKNADAILLNPKKLGYVVAI